MRGEIKHSEVRFAKPQAASNKQFNTISKFILTFGGNRFLMALAKLATKTENLAK